MTNLFAPAVRPLPDPEPRPQVTPPPTAQHVLTAQEIAQTQEERLQTLEMFARHLHEAFPHLADSMGVQRAPHQFSTDEMSGAVYDPNSGSIDALRRDNANLRQQVDHMQSMVEAIFNRLPAPAGESSGQVINPGEGGSPPL